MTAIVYGVPYIPAFAHPEPWVGVRMSWIGPDGTEWDLTGSAAVGVHMQAGVRGLSMPPVQHQMTTTAATAGSRWRGSRTGMREVFWPVWVWCDTGSQEWLDYDRAWWDSLDPRTTGTWKVTQPGGEARTLPLRYVSDGDPSWAFAPGMKEWVPYGLTLQAEAPYWRGAQVEQTWTAVEPEDFFDAAGSPPFHISSGRTTATAEMTNPGNVDAFPVWWVIDATTATVGVGDRIIDIPFTVASNRLLVVDTSPAVRTAVEVDLYPDGLTAAGREAWVAAQLPTGTDRTTELGATTKFGAIPAGDSINLTITTTGAGVGRVRASFVPQFWRAW